VASCLFRFVDSMTYYIYAPMYALANYNEEPYQLWASDTTTGTERENRSKANVDALTARGLLLLDELSQAGVTGLLYPRLELGQPFMIGSKAGPEEDER
jgi:hypothetical protein